MDLIGYGKSSKPMETNLLLDHSGYIAELMDSLQIDRYSPVGHAMEGQIAIHHTLTYPERIYKLILVAPAGIETFTGAQNTMRKARPLSAIVNTSQEAIIAKVRHQFFRFPEEAMFMIRDRTAITEDPQMEAYANALASGIKGMADQPVYDQLGEIQVPTLVLFGAEDREIPHTLYNPNLSQADILETAKEKIPQAETHLIPAAGHMLMFERHDVVNALIREFLLESNMRR